MTELANGFTLPSQALDLMTAAPIGSGVVLTTAATTTSPTSDTGVTSTAGISVLTAVLSGAVIAAVVSGIINYFLAWRAARLEERSRVRTSLAEAYQAYADYKEFPYAIRRRRHDDPAGEWVRLSEEIRKVQSRLSFYVAWTQVEDDQIGRAYGELVGELREIAGGYMRDAWAESDAATKDADMNIGLDKVDLRKLQPVEEKFLAAAEKHIAQIAKPWWARRQMSRQVTPETPT